jgi:cystathionine beta-lyase/cystathionine gamma-synthase
MESYEYGRYGNPTAQVCEAKIKALEGAADCLVSASGMNAVTSMLLSLVPAGGHIVTTSDCYWRTRQFMQNFLPKMNIGVSVIKPNDLEALQLELKAHNVTLFFSESPTNPYLRCVDIPAISRLCHAAGAVVCIDSTFATPINQQALALGADLVLHSATKYLAGHNDVLAGALAGSPELVGKVREFHHIMGGVVDPHAAYLLLRGMKTLELRVERHNASAMEIAKRLEKHPKARGRGCAACVPACSSRRGRSHGVRAQQRLWRTRRPEGTQLAVAAPAARLEPAGVDCHPAAMSVAALLRSCRRSTACGTRGWPRTRITRSRSARCAATAAW